MSSNINPKNLANTIDNLFGGAPVILFVGANYDIKQYPELLIKPWSAVITSSCDSSLTTLFEKSNPREFTNNEAFKEKSIFNRKQLPIIYINGISDADDHTEDYSVQMQREMTRGKMLEEIAKAVNLTFGTILFAGYSPNDKTELSGDELFKGFINLRHQALWFFGSYDGVKGIDVLLSQQIAKSYSFNIGEILQKYSKDDNYNYDEYDEVPLRYDERTDIYSIYLRGKIINIDSSAVRSFLPFGRMLTMADMNAANVSYNLLTEWFYKFLKDSYGEPQWYAYDPRWQFNFKREFDDKLFEAVKSDFEKGQDKPIVVFGQACSGKSIALDFLAWRLFNEMHLPVICIKNSNLIVTNDEEWVKSLELLVNALEKSGADKVVIIWDGSFYNLSSNERALNLQTFFKNRGKNVIIVTSAVTIPKKSAEKKYNAIEVGVNLSDNEYKALKHLLIEKGRIPRDTLEKWFENNKDESNLLCLLYKLVFSIHPELELSLGNEIRACLREVKKELETLPISELVVVELTAIGKQFEKLGLFPTLNEYAATNIDWNKRLDDFYHQIAVCSRFGFAMPVSFAMKLLEVNNPMYREAIFDLPSFSFRADSDFHQGEYSIAFRTPIEAELYLSGTSDKTQFEIIASLINSVTDDFYASDIDFIVRLIRSVGPNSDFLSFHSYCPIIIDALRELRKKVVDIGLVIQEVVYIREFYGPNNKNDGDIDPDTQVKFLEDSKDLAHTILTGIKSGKYYCNSNAAQNSLAVEYALGLLALQDVSDNDIQLPFDDIYELLSNVIFQSPNNSYPYTALIRIATAKINSTQTLNKDKYRYIGDIRELIDDVDVSFPDVYENEFFAGAVKRFFESSDSMLQKDEAESYITKLLSDGLPIGLYLKVSTLLRKNNIELSKPLDEGSKVVCKTAIDMLERKEYSELSEYHSGCQYTLLRLKYLYYNATPMFSGIERQRPKLKKEQWLEILRIANNFIEQIIPTNQKLLYKNKIYYAQALSLAQLGEFSKAESAFANITEDRFYTPVRVKTWHLLCDNHGMLVTFTGRYKGQRINGREKGYLQINGFEKGVHYSNLGFLNATGNENVLGELCVGMSFIGFTVYSKNHPLISGANGNAN